MYDKEMLLDVISHHYFDIDADEIFWVCDKNLKGLAIVLQKIIRDVQQG